MLANPNESLRLFIAIVIPKHIIDSLLTLEPDFKGLRFMPGGQTHLTLRFIPSLPARDLERLKNVLRNVDFCEPFELEVKGLGAFVRGPGAVLWAGITPNAQLAKIKQDIDLDLVSSLGFGVDKKFLPHLTLARTKKNSQSVATLARKFEGRLFGRFMVTDLILYQSKLQPTGVIHTPLEVITLKKSQDPALE